jgi:hypothetical protein
MICFLSEKIKEKEIDPICFFAAFDSFRILAEVHKTESIWLRRAQYLSPCLTLVFVLGAWNHIYSLSNRHFNMLDSVKKSLFLTQRSLFFTLELPFFTLPFCSVKKSNSSVKKSTLEKKS